VTGFNPAVRDRYFGEVEVRVSAADTNWLVVSQTNGVELARVDHNANVKYKAAPEVVLISVLYTLNEQQQRNQRLCQAGRALKDSYCETHKRLIILQTVMAQDLADHGYPTNGLVDVLEDGCR
jgi:hypothetical protein